MISIAFVKAAQNYDGAGYIKLLLVGCAANVWSKLHSSNLICKYKRNGSYIKIG